MKHRIYDSQILDYIHLIFDTFLELRGDRKSGDDKTVIGGLARLGNYKAVVIGYQRNRSVETPKAPDAKGYRKCSRLISLAEAFSKPVIIFIDIPELSVSLESGQQENETIARNLQEMSCLTTPVIGIITGESNGFMAMDVCAVDRILMLESASFLISTSSGATSADDADAASLYLTVQDLLDLNIVHRMVKGAPEDELESTAIALREAILEELQQLIRVHPETLVRQRLHRLQNQFLSFGTFEIPLGT